MPLLVKFNADYANEFTIEGFRIFINSEDWENVKEGMVGGESFFGSSQAIEYADKDDQLNHFEEFELTMFDIECLCITLHLDKLWEQIDKFKWKSVQYGFFCPRSNNW